MVAERLGASWLRIDTIEQALRNGGLSSAAIGAAGYGVAQALAADQLALGQGVVADCVNPVPESRAGWRAVAARAGVRLVELEIICSDAMEHRRRVEGRVGDIAGLTPPDWPAVTSRHYAPWDRPHPVIDTARLDPAAAVAAVLREIVTPQIVTPYIVTS
jgi:predicted kinase